MKIEKGTVLGPYEIQSLIGAGGMGQVYRARDTRLDRDVAVKVMPDHFSANENLRSRFEREARLISSLNHPNICVLHDVGSSDGIDFFVMELVDGQTLDERVHRGPLSPEETIAIGAQIARALEHAHGHGVVHRDLKPSNVMLTSSGVKLLDFGLSKILREPDDELIGDNSATVHRAITEEGMVLGTLQYMAPEQAEGKPADARTDVFALGAVLYEMVTGRRAFEGKSRASLIAAIMAIDPPEVTSVRPEAPPALARVIATCLEKEPDDRWQTAHDVRLALEMARASSSGVKGSEARRRVRDFVPWMIAALALLMAVATIFLDRAAAPPMAATFEVLPGEKLFDTSDAPVVLSPDGRRFLVGMFDPGAGRKSEIHIRDLDSLEIRKIASNHHVYDASWSWNGEQIVFFSDYKLRKVAANGGPVSTLAESRDSRGASWGPDGTILYSPDVASGIMRVSEQGGETTTVTTVDGAAKETGHWRPEFLPDGRHFLYVVGSSDTGRSGIYLGSIDGKLSRRLIGTASAPVFAAPDQVLYHHEGNLYAQRLDMDELVPAGSPTLVASSVSYSDQFSNPGYSASRTGVLAYHRRVGDRETPVFRYDRDGRRLPGDDLTGVNLDLSRDDTRLAAMDSSGEIPDIWIHDLARKTRTRITTGNTAHFGPVWSPDGREIAYGTFAGGKISLHRKRASGVGDPELILDVENGGEIVDWSRDGLNLLIEFAGPDTRGNLGMIDLSSDTKELRPLIATPFHEHSGRFSPDGRWLAYMADDAGAPEIFVQPFPPDGSRWQISNGGGEAPRWSGDSSELFWVSRGTLMVSKIDSSKGFQASEPQSLFKVESSDFVVASNGELFLIASPSSSEMSPIVIHTRGAAGAKLKIEN